MGNMFRCTLKSGGASGTGIPLIVTCSEDFAGKTITATDGTTTLTETCPSTSPYTVQFDLPNTGSWTISGVIEGVTYSETISVTEYQLSLDSGFDYKTWVSRGGLDPDDYASLSAVFADEAAVRRLMLVHASADYLIDCVTDDITKIDDFCANDTAMKWLGLCDYVCDGLTAITGVKAKLLASAYWERYLKDHVPVMTGNTAPYGEASASNTYGSGYEAYRAFDNDNTTRWAGASTPQENTKLFYKFSNPTCVKKIRVHSSSAMTITPIASNDGSNWENLSEGRAFSANEDYTFEASIDDYYLYYGVNCTNLGGGGATIYTLQFYGRSLNVSVPTMTSNTAPYGEVLKSSEYNSNLQGWKAFDNSSSTKWSVSVSDTDPYVGYDFGKKVVIKEFQVQSYDANTKSFTYLLKGSNDKQNWTPLMTEVTNSTPASLMTYSIEHEETFRYIALFTKTVGSTGCDCHTLQFYGLDYSEKEFEAGTTKKWLYDHGVELENITAYKANASNTAEKENNQLYLKGSVQSSIFGFRTESKIDLTAYSLIRTKVGDKGGSQTRLYFIGVVNNMTDAHSSAVAEGTADIANAPNNESLSISSVNGSYYPVLRETNGSSDSSGSIAEWWLE